MKRNLIILCGLAIVGSIAYFILSGDKEPIRYDPIFYEDCERYLNRDSY